MAGFDSYNFPSDFNESLGDSSKTLFVGDLSYFCTEEDLLSIFSGYGPILTVRVRRGITGDSLMHGFVALAAADSAQRAIRDLDGIEFMGRNMRVQLSADGQKPITDIKEDYIQVHVSFISKQVNYLITEKVLRDIFAEYGAVADVAIKKHSTLQKQHRQSGYGFVYFLESDAAYRAMVALKHNTVKDITLDCSISHKSEQLVQPGSRNPGGMNSSPRYGTAGIPTSTYSTYSRPNPGNYGNPRSPAYNVPRSAGYGGGQAPQYVPHQIQVGEPRFSSYGSSNPQSLVISPYAQQNRVPVDPINARMQAGPRRTSSFPYESASPMSSYSPIGGSYYQNQGQPQRRPEQSNYGNNFNRSGHPVDLNRGTYYPSDAQVRGHRFPGLHSEGGQPPSHESYPRDSQYPSLSTYNDAYQANPTQQNQSTYLDSQSRRREPSDHYNPSNLAASLSDLSIRTQSDLPRTNSEYSSQPSPMYEGYQSDNSFYGLQSQATRVIGSRTNSAITATTADTNYHIEQNHNFNQGFHREYSSTVGEGNNAQSSLNYQRDYQGIQIAEETPLEGGNFPSEFEPKQEENPFTRAPTAPTDEKDDIQDAE